MHSTPYLSFQIHQVFCCSCRGYKVRWKWNGMGLDLGGVGGGDEYDQTTMYEVCKELIKTSFKEMLSTQHKSVISIKCKQHSPQN